MVPPKQEGKRKELVPQGNHVARLYEIMYLGTLTTPFLNDDGTPKEQYKVRLTFELPNEKRMFGAEGEEKELPMVISKECTFSLYKGTQTAVLRTIAHALIGTTLKDEEAEVFDIDDLLGRACMLEVAHETHKESGQTYAKAVGFGSLPKGVEAPAQVNESKTLSVQEMTKEDIDALPDFLAKKMQSSKEYNLRFTARSENVTNSSVPDYPTEEINPEDIPFNRE